MCTFWVAAVASAALLSAHPASAEPVGWAQPDGPGTAVTLTYSFSNLANSQLVQEIGWVHVREATEEAFALWSTYAPLNFIERSDFGGVVSDADYAPAGLADIRIGTHADGGADILAHAFLPTDSDSGLAGDVHVNGVHGLRWAIGGTFPAVDFLEVITHELGHSLGVNHLAGNAVMAPTHRHLFHGLGTAFLLPPDIRAIRALYGSGVGSVRPTPEPSSLLLIAGGLGALLIRRRHRPGTTGRSPATPQS